MVINSMKNIDMGGLKNKVEFPNFSKKKWCPKETSITIYENWRFYAESLNIKCIHHVETTYLRSLIKDIFNPLAIRRS